MMVERQKCRILKIKDGERICIETLRTQMLQSIAKAARRGLSFQLIGAIHLFAVL